ncbi:MAG: hypothetical protein KDA22_07570 [Phycisphaerales bacterium]|nr:hypothetical protein [Phycisphaerales bacterium]
MAAPRLRLLVAVLVLLHGAGAIRALHEVSHAVDDGCRGTALACCGHAAAHAAEPGRSDTPAPDAPRHNERDCPVCVLLAHGWAAPPAPVSGPGLHLDPRAVALVGDAEQLASRTTAPRSTRGPPVIA